MKYYLEVQNKNGELFEYEVELSYSIDSGQKGIYNAPMDRCCEHIDASVDDVRVESCKLLYGNHDYKIGADSVLIDVIEEMVAEDDCILDAIMEHESDMQEDGRW